MNAFRIAALVLAAAPAAARSLDVNCTEKAGADSAALAAADARSAPGDALHIHGTCLLTATLSLEGGRSYLGDGRSATVLMQAPHASLPALAASDTWLQNKPYTGEPVTVAHLTLDGSRDANSGTTALVIRSWLSTVDDVAVLNAPADGIAVTNLSQDGTTLDTTQVNSRFSSLYIENSGANGFHVIDTQNAVTDSNLLESWIANSGASAVQMDNAAGWVIRGNHLYGVGVHAIYASRCYGTTIEANYIENFGGAGGAGPFYGVVCTAQGGAASVISGNKVSAASGGGAESRVFIAIANVNYGTGLVNVTGNAVLGTGKKGEIGLLFDGGSHSLNVLSADNAVVNVATPRFVTNSAHLIPGY